MIPRSFDGRMEAGVGDKFAQQVIRSTYVQSDSHCILFPFLYRCNGREFHRVLIALGVFETVFAN